MTLEMPPIPVVRVDLESMDRRELRAMARDYGISRWVRLSIEDLREALREAIAEDPITTEVTGWKPPTRPGQPWTPITRTIRREV